MAFENLSDKLQNVFKKLRGKGILTEADVDVALKEVRMALLEADVNFKIVKQFNAAVKERAIGEDVMKSLTPGQMVIKIVNEELVSLMGGEAVELELLPGMAKTIIMMVGLQGSGKTTTAAKLAGKLKEQGKRPLLVACDIYRPAAIEQLRINAEKVGVPLFEMGTGNKASAIAQSAIQFATDNNKNVIIIDTAGRLQIDEDMMQELEDIKKTVDVTKTLLVVDAMTGQDAVNIAQGFADRIGIDGVILTKLDGDARGGAALSVRAVTGVPIIYAGMGEKLTDLEQFYPDRMASRILGMGDVLSLIEKAEAAVDEEEARDMAERLKKNEINFEDYLVSMKQMKQMGGLAEVLKMMPGFSSSSLMIDDTKLARMEAIISSMTIKERRNPKILNVSRKNRIAKGAGVDIMEVNRMVKQFEQSKKAIKQMGGIGGLMGGKRGKGMMGMLGKRGMKGLF
ncbi:MAG: signal recognition particle protein [Lachnospiraceae bacterium]|nr:signal recognition particle protein [Lachnospiraceae bacterium]MBR3261740.1 signal recognition particle protein [Lachnospiraceae bacterium]MBR3361079.1 signal recognition particle protein [Lachnospiraceae bacterium]MBR6356878.1 signal recognition particle protein [Lachnospiraceae bacterium]